MDFVTGHGNFRCEESAPSAPHQLRLLQLGHGIDDTEAVDLALTALDPLQIDDATAQHLQAPANPHQLTPGAVVLEHVFIEAVLTQPAEVARDVLGTG